MVAAHWYSRTALALIAVLVAEVVFWAHEPGGPQRTLPAVPVLEVAQFTVTEVWIESVRYG
jgi:hypothetical protein